MAIGGRAASLHLHERHQGASPEYEIDIVPAGSEAVGLHLPATGCHVREGGSFTCHAEPVARIRPLGDRDMPPASCHPDQDRVIRVTRVTALPLT